MSSRAWYTVSRRAALTGFALTAAYGSAVAEQVSDSMSGENGAGPVFSPSGPNAELYGAAEGFPIADRSLAHQPGEPHQVKYRVGAYSHFDEIYPTHRIKRAAAPWIFKRSQADIRYYFWGKRSSVAEYLSRNPVTGLLIAKDDQILFEHYQYGRTDRDRLISQSMAKSITAMLIGIAIGEGAIKSVDDAAETYVPGFKDTEYGKTPIRDLLHISSGVKFGETKGRSTRPQSPVDRYGTWVRTDEGHHQQHRAIQPADRGAGDEILLCKHRSRCAWRSPPLRRQPIGVRLSPGKVMGADRRRSRRLMGGRCARLRSGTWLLQRRAPRLCAARASSRPRWRLGSQANHSCTIHDRRDDDAVVRRLSCAGQSHADVWLWLFPVAASGSPTPVRARRRQRPTHLCRSNLEADHGPDGCREYR